MNTEKAQQVLKDKILREIEELKLMKVEGESFTTAVKFAIIILENILERWDKDE